MGRRRGRRMGRRWGEAAVQHIWLLFTVILFFRFFPRAGIFEVFWQLGSCNIHANKR